MADYREDTQYHLSVSSFHYDDTRSEPLKESDSFFFSSSLNYINTIIDIHDELKTFSDDVQDYNDADFFEPKDLLSNSALVVSDYSFTSTKVCKSNDTEKASLSSSSTPQEPVKGKPKGLNKGRWTSDESIKFVEGLVLYGIEWKKIQKIIKTRSPTQTRSHAQKFFGKMKLELSAKNKENNINGIDQKDIHDYFCAILSKNSIEPRRNFYEIIMPMINPNCSNSNDDNSISSNVDLVIEGNNDTTMKCKYFSIMKVSKQTC